MINILKAVCDVIFDDSETVKCYMYIFFMINVIYCVLMNPV